MDDIEAILKQRYKCIIDELHLRNPPSIRWAPDNELHGFDGMFCWNTHEIKIAEKLKFKTDEYVNHLLIHEVTHWLMNEAGYCSIGHGWQFLAAFALLLHRMGVGGDKDIEGCICKNWPRWPSWPIWYHHLTRAQQVYFQVSQQSDFKSLCGMQIANAVFAEDKKLHPFFNWAYRFFLHLSHNVFADTRGHWLACRYIPIGCFIISFILMKAGFNVVATFFFVAGLLFITVFGKMLGKQIKQI